MTKDILRARHNINWQDVQLSIFQPDIIKLNILIMIMVGKLEIAHMKFSPNLNTRADWERHEAAMGGFSYKEILESR